jgi:tetratricopeptide (TPR) repeat protein
VNWKDINRLYVYPARSAWQAGRIEEAESLFRKGLTETNNDGYVALRYAEFLEGCGRSKDAEEMYRIAMKKLPLPNYAQMAKEGLERVSGSARIAVDYSRLATYIIKEFGRRYDREYVQYFSRMGFSHETILDPNVLFRFLATLSYDMRPLSYQQVWGPPNHPEFDNNSVRQALEHLGIELAIVKKIDEETLREKLRSKELMVRENKFRMDVHDWGERGSIDHARGLKELAANVENIAGLLNDLKLAGSIGEVYDAIDSIPGFGVALTSKTILFIVRCFGVGFSEIDPKNLRSVVNGLLSELVIERRAKRLEAKGIDIQSLIDKMTELGDPLAIELLYLLDREEDFQDLLAHVT